MCDVQILFCEERVHNMYVMIGFDTNDERTLSKLNPLIRSYVLTDQVPHIH